MDSKWEDRGASVSSCEYFSVYIQYTHTPLHFILTESENTCFLHRGSFGRRWDFLLAASSFSSLKRLSTWWSVWVAVIFLQSPYPIVICKIWITDYSEWLCEQGNVQVFYQELPLSIQDGYEKFLSSSTVRLQEYQVRENIPTDILKEAWTASNKVFFFYIS